MGEAIKIDEEVPITIPNMIAKPNPRITGPDQRERQYRQDHR